MKPARSAVIDEAVWSMEPQPARAGKRMAPNWREGLPTARDFYAAQLPDLAPTKRGVWASAVCPFHADQERSLRINLDCPHGKWTCKLGCGHGDMVQFHMRRAGLIFKDAAAELLRIAQSHSI